MKKILMFMMALTLTACSGQAQKTKTEKKQVTTEAKTEKFRVTKTDADWQKVLSEQEYQVLRNKATERPFTGEYYKHFEKGVYACAACGNPLFSSDAKFDSECGWPSFDQAIPKSVIYKDDSTLGMKRVEVMCANCGGHLGHVFDDGPKKTTGERYCTNSVSIKFIPAKK